MFDTKRMTSSDRQQGKRVLTRNSMIRSIIRNFIVILYILWKNRVSLIRTTIFLTIVGMAVIIGIKSSTINAMNSKVASFEAEMQAANLNHIAKQKELEEEYIAEISNLSMEKEELEAQIVEFQYLLESKEDIIFLLQEDIAMLQSQMKSYKDFEDEVLLRLLFCEGIGGTEKEQLAIVSTVLNRLESKSFVNADIVLKVIFQVNAFSPATNGKVFRVEISEKDREKLQSIIDRARAGEDPTEKTLGGGGALYFYSPKYCSEEALKERENIKVKVQFGDTIFYRVWNK